MKRAIPIPRFPKKAPSPPAGFSLFRSTKPFPTAAQSPGNKPAPSSRQQNEGTDHAEHHLQYDLSTFHLGFDRWHRSDPGEPPSYHLANAISVERVSHENADAQGGQPGCYDLGHPPAGFLGRPLDWVCGRRGVLPADPRQRIGKRRLEARTGEESAGPKPAPL